MVDVIGVVIAVLAAMGLVFGVGMLRYVARLADPLPQYRVPASRAVSDDEQTFVGGLRAASLHASWGAARLTVGPERVVLGPSLRPIGIVLPTWQFPSQVVSGMEPVTTWPRLDGVRVWVGDKAIVFLARGGSGAVLDAAEACGYPVDGQRKRVSMYDPKSTLAD